MPKEGEMPMNFQIIDIGTSKTCSIIAEVDKAGMMSVLGVGVVPSKGMRKGVVVDIDGARRSVQEAVKMAQSASGIEMKSAFVSITGRHLHSVNNRGTVDIFPPSRRVSPGDVRKAVAESRNINVPSDRNLVRIIPRYYILDGQVEVKDPLGMHGFRLDADTHLVTGSITAIRNLIDCVRGAGVDVEDLIPGAVAAGEAVLTEEEKELGVLLADIGGGTTDIALFKQGGVWHSAALPVGGYQVTRDLSIGLEAPFELAEEAKIRFGNVTPGHEPEETISLGDGYTVYGREFHEIINARVEEIFKLIFAEISSHEYEITAPAGLILTGGTANLPGIEAFGQEVSGFSVRVRVPRDIAGPADILYDPAYAASVGLLLWGAKHGAEVWWKADELTPAAFPWTNATAWGMGWDKTGSIT
jgi:cell division protein FtsA